MPMWYEAEGNRRGALGGTSFEGTVSAVVGVLLYLAAEGPDEVEGIAEGIGLSERATQALLDIIVEAGGATVNDGTYTGVLVGNA